MGTFPSKNMDKFHENMKKLHFEKYKIEKECMEVCRYMVNNPGCTPEDISNYSKSLNTSQEEYNNYMIIEIKRQEEEKAYFYNQQAKYYEELNRKIRIQERKDNRNVDDIKLRWEVRIEKRKLQQLINKDIEAVEIKKRRI